MGNAVHDVTLVRSTAVKVLGANSARKGYTVQNLSASNAVLVRVNAAPAPVAVTGVIHILLSAVPTGGTFKVRATDRGTGVASTTTALAAGISNANLQIALRLLTNMASVTVGNPDSGIGYKVTLTSAPYPIYRFEIVESTLAIAGTAEVQTATVAVGAGPDTATGGTFRLRWPTQFLNGIARILTSQWFAHDASAATIQAALRAKFNDVALTVSGTMASAVAVTFGEVGPKQLFEVESRMTNTAGAEVQTLTPSATPTEGTFKIKFGTLKTAAIDFDATAGEIQTALRLLTGFGAVTVAGTLATTVVMTLTGVDGDANLATIAESTLQIAGTGEEQKIAFSGTPDEGAFTVLLGAEESPSVTFDDADPDGTLQAWIQTLEGHEDTTVTGSFAAGFTFAFSDELGEVAMLVEGENTLEASNIAVTTTITEEVNNIVDIVVTVANVETTPGASNRAIVVGVVRTTPGVAARTVDDSLVYTTQTDSTTAAYSLAAATTLDQSAAGLTGSLYLLCELAGAAALRVTEVF